MREQRRAETEYQRQADFQLQVAQQSQKREDDPWGPVIDPASDGDDIVEKLNQQRLLEMEEAQHDSEFVAEWVREGIGYSTAVKPSLIPGAGMGLFINGHAPAGALVGIFPGMVHLPENVRREEYLDKLLPDKNFELMVRTDNTIIDSRERGKWPDRPLAQAHMANHPPKGTAPNVLQVAYDVPVKDNNKKDFAPADTSFPPQLRPLIPNEYKVPPRFMGGKIDRSMSMDCVVLIA
ncbi:unnamed protein product, partial [Chrysoparadoxa australica]